MVVPRTAAAGGRRPVDKTVGAAAMLPPQPFRIRNYLAAGGAAGISGAGVGLPCGALDVALMLAALAGGRARNYCTPCADPRRGRIGRHQYHRRQHTKSHQYPSHRYDLPVRKETGTNQRHHGGHPALANHSHPRAGPPSARFFSGISLSCLTAPTDCQTRAGASVCGIARLTLLAVLDLFAASTTMSGMVSEETP